MLLFVGSLLLAIGIVLPKIRCLAFSQEASPRKLICGTDDAIARIFDGKQTKSGYGYLFVDKRRIRLLSVILFYFFLLSQ